MEIEEIKVGYFHEGLRLAQRAIYSGMLVSATSYLTVFSGEAKGAYVIPFISIEVSSLNSLALALLSLYFLCGCLCTYGIQRAYQNWWSLPNRELANSLLLAPNILSSNNYLRGILYSLFVGVSYCLIIQVSKFGGWQAVLSGIALASPYFIALNLSGSFHARASETANSPLKAET